MSWWHRDYQHDKVRHLVEEMEHSFNWLTLNWTNWKPPDWFYRLWDLYAQACKDIDWDVSYDSSVPYDFFDELRNNVLDLLK